MDADEVKYIVDKWTYLHEHHGLMLERIRRALETQTHMWPAAASPAEISQDLYHEICDILYQHLGD